MADAPSGGAPNAPPAENLPEFKAPTVAPPTAPQGADAAYNEQVAKIEFSLNNQLAGDKEAFSNAQTAYNYNRSLYAQKLPEEVGTQRFRAALGGWGNSGFEGRAQGRIQANFLNKNTANLTKFQEAANLQNRRAGEQVGNRGFALADQQKEAERRYKAQQIKNAPQEPQPAAPPVPAPAQAPLPEIISERAQPRSGAARSPRRAAANKAKKR